MNPGRLRLAAAKQRSLFPICVHEVHELVLGHASENAAPLCARGEHHDSYFGDSAEGR
ncbi:protein of unknown function (plasmid) [Cupriavidus taiwanensis]|uniref:Uncharacterized protein n=1 Tax=Cupriavidus taiwanensis TaxID=164546 RepID=A0A375EEA2_9BURK|nr:protein of unknown function [Cupriavidus taiwanensis]SOZ72283.1 protein of unknown function [Cupriavidus taiwanensis]SOZ74576.1 protein of unknown function [Cupriavidus taiwanensis]